MIPVWLEPRDPNNPLGQVRLVTDGYINVVNEIGLDYHSILVIIQGWSATNVLLHGRAARVTAHGPAVPHPKGSLMEAVHNTVEKWCNEHGIKERGNIQEGN